MQLALFIGEETHILEPSKVYVLGRASNVDIRIQNQNVSRMHCRVSFSDGVWTLEDLDSSHGTLIEGKKVSICVVDKNVSGKLGGAKGPIFELSLIENKNWRGTTAEIQIPDSISTQNKLRIPLKNRLTIGSDERNDWVISDNSVDNFHAEINMSQAGVYEITCLKSSNITLVNGTKTKRRILKTGDLISIGQVRKRFTMDGLEEISGLRGTRIELRKVSFRTPEGAWLLKDLNLSIGPSTLTAFVGPSGAGKSTLMDVITGRRAATFGLVKIGHGDEEDVRIGFVPQSDILHTNLTVRQALLFGADLRFPTTMSKQEKQARVDEVLELVELTTRANLRIDRLSGGQKKRCSIALELLSAPDILILDEPTSGLDPGLDLYFMELLQSLSALGQTILVVTHAIENVGVCDNVVLLRTGGTLGYSGPPSTVFSVMKETSWAKIFRSLSEPAVVDTKSIEETVPSVEKLVRKVPVLQSTASQMFTLVRRYIAVIIADKFYVALLLVLPLVLGFIGFASGINAGLSLVEVDATRTLPNPQARTVALILILGSIFICLSASTQEIVKERDIRIRESHVGVRTSAYLGSKLVVLGAISSVQIMTFYFFTTLGRSTGDSPLIFGDTKAELAIVCLLLGLSAMCIGLVISSLISSQEQGMPSLVLMTMAQVILSGALPIRLTWLTDYLGVINPAYWAMNALGATTNLNIVTGLPGSEAEPRWNPLVSNFTSGITIISLISLFAILATYFALNKESKR
jgi:ABC-type multidrug transport system ATPase subunit